MHNFIRDNWDKTKYLAAGALTLIIVLILLTTNYKNDELVKSKKRIASYHESELSLVKNSFPDSRGRPHAGIFIPIVVLRTSEI